MAWLWECWACWVCGKVSQFPYISTAVQPLSLLEPSDKTSRNVPVGEWLPRLLTRGSPSVWKLRVGSKSCQFAMLAPHCITREVGSIGDMVVNVGSIWRPASSVAWVVAGRYSIGAGW